MGFWSSLKGTLSSFIGKIGEKINAVYQKAKEIVTGAAKCIYEKCKAALLWIWRQLKKFFSFVVELVSDLLKHILNKIMQAGPLAERLLNYLHDNAYKLAKIMSAMFKCKH